MSDSYIQVPTDGAGKKLDTEQYTVAAETVHRQRLQLSKTVHITTTFTRPSNTTPYTLDDVIGPTGGGDGKTTFVDAGRDGAESGIVMSAVMILSTVQSVKLDARLYLFDLSFTVEADNAPFDPADSELDNCIGYIDFGAVPATVTTVGCVYQALGQNIPFKAIAGGDLVGVLVARNAYVPASAEVFTIRLSIMQD